LGRDPIGGGLVSSLARPGSNVTGLSSQAADTAAKRIELLREVAPIFTGWPFSPVPAIYPGWRHAKRRRRPARSASKPSRSKFVERKTLLPPSWN